MSDTQSSESSVDTRVVADAARRDFIKLAGKIAVTAPAVAILLRASAASATGTNPYGGVIEHPAYTYNQYQFHSFRDWIGHWFNWRD